MEHSWGKVMGWKLGWTAIACGVLCTAGQLAAQDTYLAQIYGDGVHRYFRQDQGGAKCRFDEAINHGSRDPRVYYFRAIVALQQGDVAAAESDIQQGARYELEGRGTYDVWRALDRVQGAHRLQFECVRRTAMLDLRKQSVIDRYPLDPTAPDTDLLRQPADPYQTPLEPDVPSMPDSDSSDPFADEPPEAPYADETDADAMPDDQAEPAEREPMADEDDTQAEVDDPFADDDMGADAADDPFADDAPMDEPPGEAAPAEGAGDDDPFADDAAADDPFGDSMDDADDAAVEDPFGDDAAPADDDPFGDIFE